MNMISAFVFFSLPCFSFKSARLGQIIMNGAFASSSITFLIKVFVCGFVGSAFIHMHFNLFSTTFRIYFFTSHYLFGILHKSHYLWTTNDLHMFVTCMRQVVWISLYCGANFRPLFFEWPLYKRKTIVTAADGRMACGFKRINIINPATYKPIKSHGLNSFWTRTDSILPCSISCVV